MDKGRIRLTGETLTLEELERIAVYGENASPIFRKTPWRPSAVPLNTATVLSWTSI